MKYKHQCPDWDYLEIDITHDEMLACLCFPNDERVRKQKEYIAKALDLYNEKSLQNLYNFGLDI